MKHNPEQPPFLGAVLQDSTWRAGTFLPQPLAGSLVSKPKTPPVGSCSFPVSIGSRSFQNDVTNCVCMFCFPESLARACGVEQTDCGGQHRPAPCRFRKVLRHLRSRLPAPKIEILLCPLHCVPFGGIF